MPIRVITRVTSLVAAAASVALFAGCAAPAASGTGPEDAATTAASGFPLTVDNCGTEVTFEQAPERVVTIKSSTLELLLALGLE
ncbi:MAG: putative F420-0 ABC transporter substrate-binding protein, partial [Actinomycetota bacterium]|nr:putative F420-0 ABC transporter substrate-binding protein [Actinomycetota bacterium]